MGLGLWTIDSEWDDDDIPTLEEERMADDNSKLLNDDGSVTLEQIEYDQHKVRHTDEGIVRTACEHCKEEALYGAE